MSASRPRPADAATAIDAFASVARTLAADAGSGDVLARVVTAAKTVVPFDRIGLCWSEGSSDLRFRDLSAGTETRRVARSDISERLWPRNGLAAGLLEDAGAHLDPTFAIDREIAASGVSTLLRAPLRVGPAEAGLLWIGSRSESGLDARHLRLLEPIADLVALALGYDRLQRSERERRRRSEALEALLPALAQVLDVREVFRQLSRIAQEVLPHDLLGLGLFSEDRKSVRIYAASDPELADEFPIPEAMVPTIEWEFFLIRDLTFTPGTNQARARVYGDDGNPDRTIDLTLSPVASKVLRGHGIRSQLRVPLRLRGETVGGLVFNSATPDRYRPEDADVARRIADHVALALSHQRLAEEQRRLAEARERATQLEQKVVRLTEELEAKGTHRILGTSKKWKDVLAQATKVAGTETTVLLTGESGTGKEVVARLLHRGSPRAGGPFVALNCAALPDQLLESELFGHEKGAFTGAVAAKPGRIEQAAGGVLFLDEVGEMTPLVQAKLLRVLQEREFQRLGGARTLKADARVIAATNRDLAAAIARGAFREDLYYRLHVFEIRLPPLRERLDDILPLVDAFLQELGTSVARPAAGLSRDARERLLAYAWPGNVRELRNAVERALILCEGSLITSEHLPIALEPRAPARAAPGVVDLPAGGVDLDAIERDLVMKALERAGQNKSKAAKLLGLTRAQLYSRIEKHGLRP
jgi:transcriptional regulator with GAF, ATPase, and Fis domain